MGKIQFLMDTSGHCFLCLKLTTLVKPPIPEVNGVPRGPSVEQHVPNGNIVSFRNVCEYLKINVKEVCKEAMPVSAPTSSSSILEKSELNGMICADCALPYQRFSKDFLELEGLRLKLKFSLKSIYERMVGEKREGRRLEELIRKQHLLRNGFVEQFRRTTMEKCSAMVDSGTPFVLLKHVTKSMEHRIPVVDLASEPVNIQSSQNEMIDDKAVVGLSHFTPENTKGTNVKGIGQSVPESRNISEAINSEFEDPVQMPSQMETANIAKHFRLKWGGFQRKKACPKKYAQGSPTSLTKVLGQKNRHENLTDEVEESATGMDNSILEKLPETKNQLEESIPDSILSTPSPSKSISVEHECDICHDSFSSREARCDHQRSHHKGMKFVCDICHKLFPLRFNRDRHQKTCAIRPQPGAKTKRTRPETLQVRSTKTPRPKTLQGVSTKLKIQLRKKSRKDDLDDNGAILSVHDNKNQQICKFCNKNFRTKKMLRRHLTVIHRAKFECEFCQKLFSSSRSSRLHRQTVHLGRRFECKYCSQVFSQSATRNRHMKKTCTKRNGGSEKSEDLKRKQRLSSSGESGAEPITESDNSKLNHSNEEMNGSNEDEGMEDDGNQMEMECDVCQEKVSDPADHKCTHFETHLTVNEKGEVEGEEVIPKLPFLIITQPKTPTKKPQFKINPRTGRHLCLICSKEFPRSAAFHNHYKSVHLQVSYKCNLCQREFRMRSEYNRHHRDAHMGIRYKCDLCEKTFIQKTEVLEHRQIVHFGKLGYQISPASRDRKTANVNLEDIQSASGDEQGDGPAQEPMSPSGLDISDPGSHNRSYKFCTCKTRLPGRMVRCENLTCKFGAWFHYENDPPCVQYNNEEVWYCSMCRAITDCRSVKTNIRKSKV